MALASRRELALPPDDLVQPFRTVKSDVVGRVLRLGAVVDAILSRHAYPEPVSHALGEALVVTAMLGSALKPHGRLTLQTRTDGPLDFLVVDCVAPAKLRGYASFDKRDRDLAQLRGRGDQGRLLGRGHLAMTIDPGGERDSYQGIVELECEPVVAAAHAYFARSEQIPTFMRVAVARHYGAVGGMGAGWRWRAGGLMIQQLPREGGQRELAQLATDPEELAEHWNRVRHLARTVEDHELIDPLLTPERLLYRLFHEEGVRVVPTTPVLAECRCSRAHIKAMLASFDADELASMREPDGGIGVTCEFCSRKYRILAGEIG